MPALVLVGRDEARLEQTRAELVAQTGTEAIATVVADMSSLASVRAAADEILAREPRLDILVDNAGAMFADAGRDTAEGFERTFATMVLGPFVLVSRLAPRLAESPDGRLVAVTSGGMYTQSLPLDDLMFEQGPYEGAAGLCPGQARPGGDHPRMGPAAPLDRHRRQRDASGMGGHAGPGRIAAGLPEPDGRPPANARRGRGHDPLAGRGTRGPACPPDGCSSTGGSVRSIASHPPACPPRTAGHSGTGSWR